MAFLVKICGCTRPADVRAAAGAGASHVGFVFAPSPRRVSVREAEVLASVLREAEAEVVGVGVFVDEEPAAVRRIAARAGLRVVQLHGAEPPEACERIAGWGLEVWKAVRPRSREELWAGIDRYAEATDAVLVEGHSEGRAGGAGARLPWSWLEGRPEGGERPDGARVLLAGGLDPDNVEEAVARTRPDGVDVSSGVERAPGEKDPERIRRFVRRARRAASGRVGPDPRRAADAAPGGGTPGGGTPGGGAR